MARILFPSLVVVEMTAVTVFIATVQGYQSDRFDLDNTTTRDQMSSLDVSNSTRLPMSVNVELLPADELRATVSDRKQIAVKVYVGEVAPPRRQTTNCYNTTENGYSQIHLVRTETMMAGVVATLRFVQQ